jgi:hypothetical protein
VVNVFSFLLLAVRTGCNFEAAEMFYRGNFLRAYVASFCIFEREHVSNSASAFCAYYNLFPRNVGSS